MHMPSSLICLLQAVESTGLWLAAKTTLQVANGRVPIMSGLNLSKYKILGNQLEAS